LSVIRHPLKFMLPKFGTINNGNGQCNVNIDELGKLLSFGDIPSGVGDLTLSPVACTHGRPFTSKIITKAIKPDFVYTLSLKKPCAHPREVPVT